MNPSLAFVPLEKVWWDKRYRDDLGDIDTLVESIKEKGILQPITLTPDFELLAGERRVTAARKAGLLEIPALLREKQDIIDAREIELIENLHRKDPSWNERCQLTAEIDRLYKEKNIEWSGRKTAILLNRSAMSVSRDLELARAMEVAPELAQFKTADDALKVIKKVEEQALVGELRRRQIDRVAIEDGLDKGMKTMVRLADANYQIGDTFQGLAELPDGGLGGWTRFHVIECDPPYGIDLADLKRSKDNPASNVHTYEEVEQEAYPIFLKKLCTELYRVAGHHTHLVFWFGPTWQHLVLTSLREAGWLVDDIPCIWVKNQGQTMQPKTYLGRAYEPFFLCRKGSPSIAKEGRLNVFNYSTIPGSKKIHPTERPVALIEDILSTLTAPMSTVLIPFLGSGATLRAVYNCGMQGLGWDLNGEYKDRFMLAVEEDTRKLMDSPGSGELEGLEDFEADEQEDV